MLLEMKQAYDENKMYPPMRKTYEDLSKNLRDAKATTDELNFQSDRDEIQKTVAEIIRQVYTNFRQMKKSMRPYEKPLYNPDDAVNTPVPQTPEMKTPEQRASSSNSPLPFGLNPVPNLPQQQTTPLNYKLPEKSTSSNLGTETVDISSTIGGDQDTEQNVGGFKNFKDMTGHDATTKEEKDEAKDHWLTRASWHYLDQIANYYTDLIDAKWFQEPFTADEIEYMKDKGENIKAKIIIKRKQQLRKKYSDKQMANMIMKNLGIIK
jgi:hypothetical protein